MRRYVPLLIVCTLLSLLAIPALEAASPSSVNRGDRSPAAALTASLSTVTGIAISPLMGTGVYGCYRYFTTEESARAALPWFAQVSFWLPALAVVAAVAFKDSLAAALPPGFKRPLDVLETIENKFSGLVAAGAAVPFTMDALSKILADQAAATPAFQSSGLAMLTAGAIDFSWLLNLLTIPFGIFVFAVVWMASHAINVLILLSPWGAIDTALKAARTSLLGLITVSAMVDPWVGAGLSLVVILLSYLVAGWSFRLTVFGSLFCWDFFTLRRTRYNPQRSENRMFSGSLLKSDKVPVRTYGKLLPSGESNGVWRFVYRPWLLGPERSVSVSPASVELGEGLFISSLRTEDGTVFILPPRYRGHEEQLVTQYGIPGGVKPAGILRAWSGLKELFSGSSTRTQVV